MTRRQRGFTLIELVVAMALLGTMMLLLYGGLSFSVRSWDAGDVNGRRTADRRIGENFLRREISELFPMRWKEPNVVKFAFEGEKDHLRFVSSRPAGIAQGGLSLAPLDKAEATVMIAGVQGVTFEYFGSENDFTPPQWSDTWKPANRIPEAIRLRIVGDDGPLPEMAVRISLGEEAGCLENAFQRNCRPRRQ
jgi:general secretion pathway protein J